jgi:ApaG protein
MRATVHFAPLSGYRLPAHGYRLPISTPTPPAMPTSPALPRRPRSRKIGTMSGKKPYDISISVDTRFLDDQSAPADNRYAFAYTITIENRGSVGARLLSRHWVITDGNGKVREVQGDGVVGEQPWVRPGDDYEYTSGAVLETALGTMRGSYRMIADDGTHFDADIPAFVLSVPRTLH